MKIRNLFSRHTLAAALLPVGLLFTLAAPHASAATPDLPNELRENTDGKMVFMDFYSPMCSACLMMEPHLTRLKEKTADKVVFKRIDITQTHNEKYMDSYAIDSTPSYILFGPDGKAVYKMAGTLAPSVLEKQILRTTGKLKSTDFPSGIQLPGQGQTPAPQLQDMLLVAFEGPDCKACQTMTPYLNGFEMTGQEGLHVLRLDASTPDGKKLMEQLEIKAAPAYVLFDNKSATDNRSRGELFRVEGEVKPRVLWDIIKLFGQTGV